MGRRMFLEFQNKNTPIIVYNTNSDKLQKSIEEIITQIGGMELGSVKTKYYEEYFYVPKIGSWEIYVNLAVPPSKYNIGYGSKEYNNVSGFAMLINFNKQRFCNYIYDELSKIRELNGDIRSIINRY
jgi:hypothetical protein